MNNNERLFVALDVPECAQAIDLARQLTPLGVSFKIGMQLFYREGMPLVQQLQATGRRVFVDLKLHDIPNTVAHASESLVSQGVGFFNVHCLGGPEMMRAAAEAARKSARAANRAKPVVIGVTVLTSMPESQLRDALKIHESLDDYVVHLARLAQDSGLDGVVCSARETALLRKACGPDFLLVTPGIRPAGSAANDQSRVVTPADALAGGSDYLVIGRPITAADDPVAATQAILDEMNRVAVP